MKQKAVFVTSKGLPIKQITRYPFGRCESDFKTKFLGTNHANFVSKELTKATMLRSKLRNILKNLKKQSYYTKNKEMFVFCY